MFKKLSKIVACACICSVLGVAVAEARTVSIKDKKVEVRTMYRAYSDPGDTDVSVPN